MTGKINVTKYVCDICRDINNGLTKENTINTIKNLLNDEHKLTKIPSTEILSEKSKNILHDLIILVAIIDPTELLMFSNCTSFESVFDDVISEAFLTDNLIQVVLVLAKLFKKNSEDIIKIGTKLVIKNYIQNLETYKSASTNCTFIEYIEKIVLLNKHYGVNYDDSFFDYVYFLSTSKKKKSQIRDLFIVFKNDK